MPSLVTERPITTAPSAVAPSWSPRSLGILFIAWLILQFSGIFSPGLLDDVDSIYIQIAREMLQRHDFVTPYIDGIRFFDKPPLMYWMASTSMSVFGVSDWAARLPLSLAVLALLLSTYALGNRLFSSVSPAHARDRGGFYSALALATAIGPYLYTRFFIPDILIALWMTVGVHLFLIALERIADNPGARRLASETSAEAASKSTLVPCLGFAAVMALNVLTKGLIGAVFPIGFVLLYLAITRRLHLLTRFHLVSGTAAFLAIAAPWHILAALRNPAIALPAGLGLPVHGGWTWFYLYNEHIARFLSKRIPHDYGQTPVWLFWLYLAIWAMPWTTFLPAAISTHIRALRTRAMASAREHEAALALLLWSLLVLGFFTLSARQEYYSLPAIPALALMAGGVLSRAERNRTDLGATELSVKLFRWSAFFLLPLTTAVAALCAWFAIVAPRPVPGATLSTLLATNPELYNLSLGHLFDLTGPALGLFRGPLAAVAVGLAIVGVASTILRRKGHAYAANLAIATGMTITLLAAHAGLSRFNPILGSKDLAKSINAVLRPDDVIVLDGELTTGSTILFYTGHQVHLVDGRVNGLWYGSFWPDAPHVFETEVSLKALWQGPRHVFLLTSNAASRQQTLAPAAILATSGGKAVLTNFAPPRP
ncbi:4-amino-4-deoxy-L-arabinose transferase-like glycosyltransferase [Granulicella aggregans]|uniref:4-amino-4-deoxy-L-arabinose transferase-like glycosyltransferase n=1 Tax=Granulicella aggregans TaxID=474949 RepID=A0A7W7ZFH6_9BACT|nr:glycosyltransferase family 39 protein [Granulicella aggregans]MBB5059010.1 4-amino-4-deoxy-L-arabinose transferase-like glycosyltransferase [Granulicella aggregans]